MGQTLTGRCLCGTVRYTATGEALRFYHCHCSRCRQVTGTGHASNLFLEGSLVWESGEANITRFKVPGSRFSNAFCQTCGGRVPQDRAGSPMVMIPAGSLENEPDLHPQARIFLGSRAAWSCSSAALPGFDGGPG